MKTMKTNLFRIHVLCFCCITLWTACGGSSQSITPSSEFTAEHARLFKDSIDFVEDPSILVGKWKETWYNEHSERIKYADLIAVVTISTVRIDTDLDGRNVYRLIGTIDEILSGETPNKEITMKVRVGEPGYESVEGNEKRILNKRFIAFIKWYEVSEDTIAAHWHLTPASTPILENTRGFVNQSSPNAKKGPVIIYQK